MWVVLIVIGGAIISQFKFELIFLQNILMFLAEGSSVNSILPSHEALYVALLIGFNFLGILLTVGFGFFWIAETAFPIKSHRQSFYLMGELFRSLFSRASVILHYPGRKP